MTSPIKEFLDCKMQPNDASAKTVKGYFEQLLLQLWYEGEGFSGKRPFGNSNWEFEIYTAWVRAKLLKGELDEYGYLIDYNREFGRRQVTRCIKAIFKD